MLFLVNQSVFPVKGDKVLCHSNAIVAQCEADSRIARLLVSLEKTDLRKLG